MNYLLCVDTETTNCNSENLSENSLAYDIGFAVIDTNGKIYSSYSYIVSEIFFDEPDLMELAYFKDKLPQYLEDIKCGSRIVKSAWTIRKKMIEICNEWGITQIVAHNAFFDYKTLNNLIRFLSGSMVRYWFPFEKFEWLDSLKMARSVMCKMPEYRDFCFCVLGLEKVSATAENLYKFITQNTEFKESHTGLEDVLIESQIVAYCYQQQKEMETRLFTREFPKNTTFQIKFLESLKKIPVLAI